MRKILSSLACFCMLTAGAFAADTVPWSNDFSNYSASINGWKYAKLYSSSRGFTVSSGELYIQQAAMNKYNELWEFFTADGFAFEAGKDYRFDMVARTNNTSADAVNNFKLCVFAKADVDAGSYDKPVTEILSGSQLGTDASKFAGFFNVPETGEYYIGLYVYANYASRALYFDNFNLVEASMDAPAEAKIEVIPDASGILKAEVKVTAPTHTIRGDVASSMTKLVVLRDGGEVKEFASPAAGQEYTFTDYAAQPGNHTYGVQAYNEKGAGALVEAVASVGGTPEKQTWLNGRPCWAKYTPDGKIRIEWPAATDAADYKIETLGGREITGVRDTFYSVVRESRGDKDVECYAIYDTGFEAGTEPIGWQYKISKLDEDGNATQIGLTNYLCLNNQVPYYPNMSTQTSLYAFTLDNDYEYSWQYYGSNGGYVGSSVSRPYGYADKTYYYNNWLISPGLMLSKDKFYRVKVTGCSDSGTTTYTIKAGKGSYRDALDITVTEAHPTVDGDNYLTVVQTDEMFLSVPDDGQYFIGIMGSIPNAVSSDALRLQRFDIIEVNGSLPDVPTDVKVAYGDGTITFNVPAKAINGTDIEGLEKIEVLKNGELYQTITEGVIPGAAMSISIEVKAGVTDVYAIRAYNAAGQGESASAKVFVLSTPYSNDFSQKTDLDGFTCINNLGTRQNFHLQYDKVRLFYDEAGSDHWLITPPITLNAGQYYQFNYNAKATADDAGHMEIMLGNAAIADSMKQVISERFVLNSEQNIFNGLHEEWFTVEETGQYYIGFHVTHDPGRHNHEVYIDDLQIAAGVAGTVPDKGTLVVTPAADGSLTAQLTYTAPTLGLNGTPLNTNSTQDVYFYINGEQTGGIMADGTPNPATRTFKAYPGQTVSITVAVEEDMPYIFSARTGWNGRLTYFDAFVGINIPSYPDPSSIVLTETQPYGHVKMTWAPVTTDYEGYPLNPDNLVYEVMSLQQSVYNPDNIVEVPVVTDIKGTEVEFDAISKDAPQTMKRYVLRARNPLGKGSQGVLTQYVNVGKPYRMPYRETFAGDDKQPGVKTAIFSETLEGMINWGLMTDGLISVNSGDGDGCYLSMEALGIGCKGRFFTGKVNLGSGINPSLSMLVYNYDMSGTDKTSGNLLEFLVYSYGDRQWHSLGEEKTVDEICNGRPGWNKITIDLSEYADQVVICGIDATCVTHTFTSIDNIQISEIPSVDLSMQAHNAPISVAPGAEFTVKTNVVNNGLVPTTPESVEMLVDSVVVATAAGIEIPVGETATFEFTHSFPVVDMAESHEIIFRVNCADDADDADNAISTSIALLDMNLPGVENLTAVADDDLYVTLNWEAPEAPAEGRITESFEGWNAGSASQNGWTTYDGDKRGIIGIAAPGGNSALDVPGLPYNGKAAFAVIDMTEGPLTTEMGYAAKTGSNFLMSLKPLGDTGSTDDWLISPLLSGNAQTITFFARCYSSYYRAGIEVLYSEGGMNLNDFKSVVAGAISASEWTGYQVELPEGAKRFAIRNITYCEEGFMLMIDDVAYEPASGDEVALLGYNVYSEADDVLAQADETTYAFAEALEEGDYVFGVSARYAHGESHVTPVEVSVKSGIAEISAAQGIHIFGGHGCINVCNAEGRQAAVYDLSGKLLALGTVSASGRIAAAPGAYIVTVGDKTAKVIVK